MAKRLPGARALSSSPAPRKEASKSEGGETGSPKLLSESRGWGPGKWPGVGKPLGGDRTQGRFSEQPRRPQGEGSHHSVRARPQQHRQKPMKPPLQLGTSVSPSVRESTRTEPASRGTSQPDLTSKTLLSCSEGALTRRPPGMEHTGWRRGPGKRGADQGGRGTGEPPRLQTGPYTRASRRRQEGQSSLEHRQLSPEWTHLRGPRAGRPSAGGGDLKFLPGRNRRGEEGRYVMAE